MGVLARQIAPYNVTINGLLPVWCAANAKFSRSRSVSNLPGTQKHIDRIPEPVMDVLISHPWPGNIRELQNFMERSIILTRDNTLCPPLAKLMPAAQLEHSESSTTLRDSERDLICRTLKETNGIIDGPRGAAARLGVKRPTLYSRMQKLGITRSRRKMTYNRPIYFDAN